MTRLSVAFAAALEAVKVHGGVDALEAELSDDPKTADMMKLRAAVEAETARVKARMRR